MADEVYNTHDANLWEALEGAPRPSNELLLSGTDQLLLYGNSRDRNPTQMQYLQSPVLRLAFTGVDPTRLDTQYCANSDLIIIYTKVVYRMVFSPCFTPPRE